MDYISLGYFGIFIAAFLAATILPAPSEIIIVLAFQNNFSVEFVIIFATLGNSFGSFTNYYIGRFGIQLFKSKNLTFKENRKQYWIQKSNQYGYWLGFLAWVPIIGDPLIILLGALKINYKPLFATISLGKLIRYLIVTWIYFLN
jgi:membrane protein YqaA with SNARE-associated domain